MLVCDYSLIHGGINYQMILVWGRRDNRHDCVDACMNFVLPLIPSVQLSFLATVFSLQLRRHHPRDGTWCNDHSIDGRLSPWLLMLQLRRLPPEDGNRLGHSSDGRLRRHRLGNGLRRHGLGKGLRRQGLSDGLGRAVRRGGECLGRRVLDDLARGLVLLLLGLSLLPLLFKFHSLVDEGSELKEDPAKTLADCCGVVRYALG